MLVSIKPLSPWHDTQLDKCQSLLKTDEAFSYTSENFYDTLEIFVASIKIY